MRQTWTKACRWKKMRGAAKALAVQAVMSDSIESSEGQSTPPTAISGLTSEQWQTLVSLLNAAKLGPAEKLNGKCPVFHGLLTQGLLII